MMFVIQFQFVFEMGEVYIKITSDNPKQSSHNLRALKKHSIVVYFLSVVVCVSNLIIILKDSASSVNLDDLSWALALALIILVAISDRFV
jgi:hypothetical protein